MDSYTALGSRACTPCSIGEAHGVAMAMMEPGIIPTPLPFRHPELLDNEARIRVTHCGLCQGDISFARNNFGFSLYPLVPGHEVIGVVEKTGEKVNNLNEGDRVGIGFFRGCCSDCSSCVACSKGFDNVCPQKAMLLNPGFGGLATSLQASGSFFTKIPESLPSETAPLLCAGATVYSGLYKHVAPGKKVGIVGIGGLGHVGIMYAKAFGCEVTAFSRSPGKETEARAFGASHFVNMNDAESVKRAANSVDILLETANSFSISKDMEFIVPGGNLVLCGIPEPGDDLGFTVFSLMRRGTLEVITGGSKAEIAASLEFAATHGIQPVTELYPFAESQAALHSLANGVPHYPRYRNVVETASFFKTFLPAS